MNALTKVIDEIRPQSNQKIRSEFSTEVLDRLREERTEEGARPRCNEACPLCKSLCILPLGHGSVKKHETFHQPQGLTGWRWVTHSNPAKVDTLCTCSCTEGDSRFWYKKQWYSKRDFVTLFPDWMEPMFTEQFPLREYIFATFNERIALYYAAKPCLDIPAEYHHNLENIRANLLEKTNSAN